MSLILDALRKSEAERRRGSAPDLFAGLPAPTPTRRRAARKCAVQAMFLPDDAGDGDGAVVARNRVLRVPDRDAGQAVLDDGGVALRARAEAEAAAKKLLATTEDPAIRALIEQTLRLAQGDLDGAEKLLLDFQERLQKVGLFEGASVELESDPGTAAAAPTVLFGDQAKTQSAGTLMSRGQVKPL